MKRISLTILLGLLSILASISLSQDACPNPKPLKNICMSLDSRTVTPDQSMYLYKRKIFDASCVLPTDTEKVQGEKIRKMWSVYGIDLSCNSLSFDVLNGNLIKYAVSLNWDLFIADVSEWRVNLNKVDEADQRTALDYVDFQIQQNKGNALEPKLRSYSDLLIAGGAKRKSQLAPNAQVCPNPKPLVGLCLMVGNRMQDPNPIDGPYLYQRRVLEAACAVDDNETVRAEKIRKMWRQFEDELVCTNIKFDVSGGSLIKYAISTQFDDFVADIIYWKMDLNWVDPSDGRTILDYVDYHMKKNKGNALEVRLNSYYRQLRDAGAKHKAELTSK